MPGNRTQSLGFFGNVAFAGTNHQLSGSIDSARTIGEGASEQPQQQPKAEIFVRNTVSTGPVDAALFRRVMGSFATGVCIVSRIRADGSPSGFTANTLVSVSLDPMLVSWSLQNDSSQFDQFVAAERFGISILNEDQRALAQRYAARGDAQMRADDFEWSADGLPLIAGAIGTIGCRHWAAHPAGDHTIILGEVTHMAASDHGGPLGYFQGNFCRIGE